MPRRQRKPIPKSREFEALAARLEQSLAPTGARVKSPDRIRDKITGRFREVDASIRYTVGSSQLLITIECRDRVKTPDVTWIEQLATKRLHIGADRTLAVSSSPFTDAALRAARFHGISTRLISEVNDADVRSQTNTLEVSVETVELSLKTMQLRYANTLPQSPRLDSEAMTAWTADCWNAPIFRIAPSDRAASLDDLFKLAAEPHGLGLKGPPRVVIPPQAKATFGTNSLSPFLRDVPVGSDPVEKEFLLTFETEEVYALTTMGRQRIQAIAVTLTAQRSQSVVPPSKVAEYATDEHLITRFAEHKVEWESGQTWSVLSYPTPGTNRDGGRNE